MNCYRTKDVYSVNFPFEYDAATGQYSFNSSTGSKHISYVPSQNDLVMF